jgi:hypothetical protein
VQGLCGDRVSRGNLWRRQVEALYKGCRCRSKETHMPHPRKHLKQTGDTHPPEIEDDAEGVEAPQQQATLGEEGRRSGEGVSATAQGGEEATHQGPAGAGLRLDAGTERYLDAARAQVRRKPLAYAAGAFAIGFVLAVVTRS